MHARPCLPGTARVHDPGESTTRELTIRQADRTARLLSHRRIADVAVLCAAHFDRVTGTSTWRRWGGYGRGQSAHLRRRRDEAAFALPAGARDAPLSPSALPRSYPAAARSVSRAPSKRGGCRLTTAAASFPEAGPTSRRVNGVQGSSCRRSRRIAGQADSLAPPLASWRAHAALAHPNSQYGVVQCRSAADRAGGRAARWCVLETAREFERRQRVRVLRLAQPSCQACQRFCDFDASI